MPVLLTICVSVHDHESVYVPRSDVLSLGQEILFILLDLDIYVLILHA